MMQVLTQFADAVDRLNGAIGRMAMWLALAMALVQFAVVVLRYVFAVGFVPLQESIWVMNGTMFMLGAGYALSKDAHVRVDILYRGAAPRRRALVDLAGSLALLVPFAVFTFIVAWPYVRTSWAVTERSPEVAGLPGIFIVKSVILVFAVLMGLQACALAIRTGVRRAAT